jgi:hypothetical protein
MSVPHTPGPADQEPPGGFNLGSALLILVGVVLLLPGLCAVVFAFGMLPVVWDDPASLSGSVCCGSVAS